MVRNRCLTVLSMALFLAVLFPILGWCGGPCAPTDQAGAGRAGQQMPPGPAPTAAAAASPFQGGGSLGNVGAAGSNGASPEITMSDLGLNSVWGWSGRIRYNTDVMDLPVSFVADYSSAKMKGSVGSYSGPTGVDRPTWGQPVSSKFDLALLSFMAELDASPAFGSDYATPLKVGPWIGYTVYMTDFSWWQTSAPYPSSSRSRSFGMPGIGVWACLNLASLTGYASMETSGGTIAPKLRLGGGFGKGDQMRYDMWEASLEIFSRPESTEYDLTVPAMSFEIGYSRYHFDETVDRIATGTTDPSHAEHSVDVFILRLDFDLPSIY